MFTRNKNTEKFFWRITSRPVAFVTMAIIVIGAAASGLSNLVKDTSVKAFIPPGHPSLVADDKAREIFGLGDSVAVALMTSDGSTVFEPDTLSLIARLSDQIGNLSNVRDDKVTSIATESSIRGEEGALLVDPYIVDAMTPSLAEDSLERWRRMPPHQGSLVSEDGRSAIIMAELIDAGQADHTYETILAMADAQTRPGLDIHVAGPGAVSGFLGSYIDQDARKLQPLVFLLVLGFIYFAFRRLGSLPGPLFVVLGAAGGSLGIMAWNGVPYYAITNALPVIIVAISVADAIHILSAYYQYRSQEESAPVRELVVAAMTNMARPITLTTLTTIAGFVGIGAVSIMPPITAFAWYAALGVLLAWFFSLFALPNLLVLLKPGPSPAFENWTHNRPSGVGRFLAHIGSFSAKRYQLVLSLFALATVVALFGALQLRIDRSQVDNFAEDEPIRVADEQINKTFAGTAFLDVIVETDESDGLLSARRLSKIAELQDYFEQQPHVRKTVAITDYLSLLHQAIAETAGGDLRGLPDSDDAIAQYLLVYEASGDPTDFEEEIDTDYSTALIRGALNEHHFSQNRLTVEALQNYIEEVFNEPGMHATLAGDVNISYHWMTSLQQSHFKGVALSLALVLLTSSIVFRSVTSGLVSIIPVSFAVLVLYACMGYLDIYLEPATSMFAAIALGVGVDFAIHLVDKLRISLQLHDEDIDAAVDHALPPTARACYFNSAALGLGFSVLMVSSLPTLQRFGGLVTVASLTSYFAALVIVPALFAAGRSVHKRAFMPVKPSAVRVAVFAMVFLTALMFSRMSEASDVEALRIAKNVAARQEGASARRVIDIVLTDRRGRTRERRALVLKQNGDDARHTRITYLAPKAVRNVSFLSHDFQESQKADDRWLYIPATRKVRRIPASDRGDYFLGTDFTYEDIQSELKFDLADYQFEYRGQQTSDGKLQHRLSGAPIDEQTAKQLGYGAFDATVDESNWMPVRVDFFDLSDELLKTITVNVVEQIDGIWTATDIEAVNHKTGHQTRFRFKDVSYPSSLPAAVFDAPSLSRGLPSSVGALK